jgi:hypothetical protein
MWEVRKVTLPALASVQAQGLRGTLTIERPDLP